MQIDLLIDKMDVDEKLDILEAVWDSLYQKSDEILSPSWHRQVLEKREDESPIDWEDVKQNLS